MILPEDGEYSEWRNKTPPIAQSSFSTQRGDENKVEKHVVKKQGEGKQDKACESVCMQTKKKQLRL